MEIGYTIMATQDKIQNIIGSGREYTSILWLYNRLYLLTGNLNRI